jgi:peptidoglycan hydrolase-like protein with peptidoglycan-binding domain
MSRSYSILAAVLIGIVGLGAVFEVSASRSDETGDDAGADTVPAVASEAPAGDLSGAVRDELGLAAAVEVDPDCTISVPLRLGDEHDEVACLESQLIDAGVLTNSAPDRVFDESTSSAVRAFQVQNGLVVDGIVGPQTATEIGAWVGPDVLPPDPATCPGSGRSAVVDRFNQRAWLCESGDITLSQPDPGTYSVYAKDLAASSTISGEYSEMTHFVAFTYGKYQGARIAFHSVPTYADGEFVQPLNSVGSAELYGASAGCIRVLPDDAELIWNWLDVGDTVTVVT